MRTNHKLLYAVLIGVSVGITGGLGIRGQEANTAPGYVVAEAEVTDPAALQELCPEGGGIAGAFQPPLCHS